MQTLAKLHTGVCRPAWMKPAPLCMFLMDQRHVGTVGQRVQSRRAGVATVPVADHRAEDIPDETTSSSETRSQRCCNDLGCPMTEQMQRSQTTSSPGESLTSLSAFRRFSKLGSFPMRLHARWLGPTRIWPAVSSTGSYCARDPPQFEYWRIPSAAREICSVGSSILHTPAIFRS